jgi:hypothetical protein
VHAALESPVPAEAEAETYPSSAIDEPLDRSLLFDAFLPRRRPTRPAVPPSAPAASPVELGCSSRSPRSGAR